MVHVSADQLTDANVNGTSITLNPGRKKEQLRQPWHPSSTEIKKTSRKWNTEVDATAKKTDLDKRTSFQKKARESEKQVSDIKSKVF